MFSLHGLFHPSLFCYNTEYKGTYAISVSISGRSFGSTPLGSLSGLRALLACRYYTLEGSRPGAGTLDPDNPIPVPVNYTQRKNLYT